MSDLPSSQCATGVQSPLDSAPAEGLPPPRASFTNLRSIYFAIDGQGRPVYAYGGAWKLESDMEDATARDADVASTLHWHLEGHVSLDSLEGL